MNTNFYHPDSLATMWHRVVARSLSPHVAIGNFLDDWRRESEVSVRMALIRDPIPDSPDRDLHRWGAFVAALVEYLSVKAHMTPPAWVFAETWILSEPWFLNPYWKLRAWQLIATPPPWKRRRIFGGDETMLIGRV